MLGNWIGPFRLCNLCTKTGHLARIEQAEVTFKDDLGRGGVAAFRQGLNFKRENAILSKRCLSLLALGSDKRCKPCRIVVMQADGERCTQLFIRKSAERFSSLQISLEIDGRVIWEVAECILHPRYCQGVVFHVPAELRDGGLFACRVQQFTPDNVGLNDARRVT